MMDKKLTISIAASRFSTKWQRQTIWWTEFIKKLENPVRSPETLEHFLRLPKSKQDELKDVGGYVGGALINGRREQGFSYA